MDALTRVLVSLSWRGLASAMKIFFLLKSGTKGARLDIYLSSHAYIVLR